MGAKQKTDGGAGRRKEPDAVQAEIATLFDPFPECFFVADLEGRLLHANAAARARFGLPAGRPRGRRIESLHPADQRDTACELFAAMIEGRTYRCTIPALDREGKAFPVDILAGRGRWDGREAILGVFVDVSEREALETALRERESNFSAMAEGSRDGVMALSLEGGVLYANARLLELTNRSGVEIRRAPLGAWLRGGAAAQVRRQVRKIRRGAPFLHHHEATLRPAGGGDVPVELSINAIFWNRAPAVMLEVRDISWRRHLQAQVLRAVAWEKQNLGRELHDGVAQRIAGAAYLCKSAQMKLADRDPVTAASLASIGEVLHEALGSVRHLARGMLPGLADRELAESLDRLAGSVSEMFGVECRFRHNGELAGLTGERAGEVYYIVQEAVMNAVRHGRPRCIRLAAGRAGRGRIRLRIEDDGVGFDPAATAPGSLGLQIMGYRAERLDGTLRLDAAEGRGTRVECTFPAGQESAKQGKD